MNKILNLKYHMLNIIFKAYKSLKEYCDPAMEGNPYSTEREKPAYIFSRNRQLLVRNFLIGKK